ncbi:hypothetical protein Droror1_Dr00021923 [Drosera rotundifolia]
MNHRYLTLLPCIHGHLLSSHQLFLQIHTSTHPQNPTPSPLFESSTPHTQTIKVSNNTTISRIAQSQLTETKCKTQSNPQSTMHLVPHTSPPPTPPPSRVSTSPFSLQHHTISLIAAVAVVLSSSIPDTETLLNIPPTLSGDAAASAARIQRPKTRKAERCTVKCVTTCIRGGDGGPGEGPLNVRRPIVVFKSGFRSRRYCLGECAEICNLLGDRDDGP